MFVQRATGGIAVLLAVLELAETFIFFSVLCVCLPERHGEF